MSAQVTLAFLGDLCIGPEYLACAQRSRQALLRPFETVRELFSDIDIGVLNLEGPVFEGGALRPGVTVHLSNHPAALDFAEQNHFRVLSLANNHVMDHGAEGLAATLQLIQARGYVSLGAGANLEEASQPRFVERQGMKLAFLAMTGDEPHVRSVLAGPDAPGTASYKNVEIAVAAVQQARQNADLLCVILHWGREYFDFPGADQRELAHRLIDAGANLVIGHHPHVIQGIERYRDAVICYSLGNFFFPPLRADNGRLLWEKPKSREFLAVKVRLSPGQAPELSTIGGRRHDDFQMEIYEGKSRKQFEQRLETLSEPLRRADYSEFWQTYAARRRVELEREGLKEALLKIARLGPRGLLHTLRPADLTRNLKRLGRTLGNRHSPADSSN